MSQNYCWCDRVCDKKKIEMNSSRLSDMHAFPSRWILQLVCQDLVAMQW
jgi:hypothetical protein